MKFLKRIPRAMYFPLLLLGFVLLLVALKANGSSIGMFNRYFYGNLGNDLIIGNPRSIRSDEWLVKTTRIISLYQVNYSEVNSLYGTGINFSLTGLPVRNWTTLFRPQNWGFFLLPIEYAFSWWWWIRAAFLILSLYLLMLWITNQKILPSALLSLAFFFSPFIQWWYSNNAIEILPFGILLLIIFVRLVGATNLKQLILYSVTFIYLSICFAVIKYPPYQVPIVYCMVFLAVGYLLQHSKLLTWDRLKRVIPVLAVSLVVIAGLLVLWYFSYKGVIGTTLQTVYPGQRRESGGKLDPLYLLSGFFDILFLPGSAKVPSALGSNQCEAASFLILSIFILPVILFGELKAAFKRQKPDWIALAACAYVVLLSVWAFVGFPKVLARITLFSYSTSRRVMIGFGIIDILIVAYYLFRYRRDFEKKDLRIFAAIWAFIIFIAYVFIGGELRINHPQFFTQDVFVLSFALLIGSLLYLLIARYQKTFVCLFLFVSVSYTFFVNPISFGLSPILKSDFSSAIQEIKDESPEAKWVAYDSLILGEYLVANGAPTLDVTSPYPDLKLWYEFDPSHKFIDIYNRTAHVVFLEGESDKAKFNLVQKGYFTVEINPCSPTLSQVGVKFYVFIKPVSYSCLQKITTVRFPDMPLYVYERSEESNSPD